MGEWPIPLGPISLTIVTCGLQRVTDEPSARPLQATALGPVLVLPKEYEFLRCRCVDLALDQDSQASRDGASEKAVAQLLSECSARGSDRMIAYRQSGRWIQSFEPTTMPSPGASTTRLRSRGIYLVTGGLRGIGLELADYLAQTVQARLILIGRSPPRPEVELRLKVMEAAGAEVLVVLADVADSAAMQAAMAKARQRFGALDGIGVIHAAGIAGGGAVQTRSEQATSAVLRPKVHGTLVLDALVQGLAPDFVCLCSSLNAIVSRFGQADYCAGNAFLDAFAHYKQGTTSIQYTSINWDAWREVGIAARAAAEGKSRLIDLSTALTSADGIAAFLQALLSALPQVVVSTVPLQPRLALSAAPEHVVPTARSFPRPTLSQAYMPPQTELEQGLCAIWQSLLGIEPVGVADNFKDLGETP